MHDNKNPDIPLSESSVSINLSLIQQRCRELMTDTDGLELRLQEPTAAAENHGDPYNDQRLPITDTMRHMRSQQ